jgi:benzoate transport
MRSSDDLQIVIESRDMSLTQQLTVGLCTLINMLDGFDILVISFAAPAIAQAWRLSPGQLGVLFSSGLVGMTVGALGLSHLADRIGRRAVALLALAMVTVGMLASAVSGDLGQLMAARALTGAGVGAMMPTINTLVAEVASRRRRDACVCIQSAGFPLGGALGGLAIYALTAAHWRWAFLCGGGVSILLIPCVLAWMPESCGFLIERRPPGALERLNRLLARLGLAELDRLPERPAAPTTARSIRGSDADVLGPILLMSACFFLLMCSFYFLTSWTPKLLTDYGLSLRGGVTGAVLMNLGGVVGDLVFAALVIRWPADRLGPVFMVLCFLTGCLFAFAPPRLDLLLPLALALGFLLFASMSSLYAVVPTVVPTAWRATGAGIALGLGRTGAAIGPFVGGLLIGAGWDRARYLILMILPLAACAPLTHLAARHFGGGARPVVSGLARAKVPGGGRDGDRRGG